MKKIALAIAALTLCSAVPSAQAQLTKADKKAIKKAVKGKLYLRMDAPCATGRHPYGTYKKPLVEVSPEGSNVDTDTELNMGVFHADSTYWGIRINDPVELDEVDIDIDDNEVELELEGVDHAEDESTVIKLVDIRSMDDFQKAFDLAFSRTPLQDAHDDWSAEIKNAIGERKLMNGMTKRQVFYITGTPEEFIKSEEDGKQIETWKVRTDRGTKMGFFVAKKQKESAFPKTLRFEDGKLTRLGESGSASSEGFSVDN